MIRLVEPRGCALLLLLLSLSVNAWGACDQCPPIPQCNVRTPPNPVVSPANAVFCVGEEVSWAEEVDFRPCEPGYTPPACYWGLTPIVDRDSCGDPRLVEDGYQAHFEIQGVPYEPATSPGKIVFTQPGVGTVRAKVQDLGAPGCRDGNNDTWWYSAPVSFKVMKVTVSVPNPKLVVRTCDTTYRYATATVSPSLPEGAKVQWSATAPLTVLNVSDDGLTAYIRADEPTSCVQGSQIKATVGQCSGVAAVTVCEFGAFELTSSTTQPTYYNGEITFADLGEQWPIGCNWNSPVYGVRQTFHYVVDITCPLPINTAGGETVEGAPGCMAVPTETGDPWALGEGTTQYSFSDDVGFVSCSCEDAHFGIALQKSRQTYWIGSTDCVIKQQCMEVRRSSPGNSCVGFTQTVSMIDGWDGCDCLSP